MPLTYLSLHYRLLFSTKNRDVLISPEWRARLHEYRSGTVRGLGVFPEDLDGRCAQEHLLGKSLEKAEALFGEASIIYQEDVLFMGVTAFRFYVQAAIAYIRSMRAMGAHFHFRQMGALA